MLFETDFHYFFSTSKCLVPEFSPPKPSPLPPSLLPSFSSLHPSFLPSPLLLPSHPLLLLPCHPLLFIPFPLLPAPLHPLHLFLPSAFSSPFFFTSYPFPFLYPASSSLSSFAFPSFTSSFSPASHPSPFSLPPSFPFSYPASPSLSSLTSSTLSSSSSISSSSPTSTTSPWLLTPFLFLFLSLLPLFLKSKIFLSWCLVKLCRDMTLAHSASQISGMFFSLCCIIRPSMMTCCIYKLLWLK